MAGFKKSLFGFNCADVLAYIEKSHKKSAALEKKLNGEIEELNVNIDSLKEDNKKITLERDELERKLAEFNAKYEEIERLSENIGKLYLVAQANAQAIIENSENNAKLISEEVDRNLSSIDEAHESLSLLRENITKTSNEFVSEVEALIASLDDTKKQITLNSSSAEKAKEEFVEIYESIVK